MSNMGKPQKVVNTEWSFSNNTPLISVCIPLYNGEEKIAKSLQSVLKQTFTNFEIVVVDDGSTDQSRFIVTSMMKEDARIRLIIHEKNFGRPYARNTCLRECRGQYIAFLDADDTWNCDFLKHMLHALNETAEASACFCAYLRLSVASNTRRLCKPVISDDMVRQMLSGCNFHPTLAMLARKNAFDEIGYFDTNLKRGQDRDWLLRFFAAGKKSVTINNQLAKYNFNSQRKVTLQELKERTAFSSKYKERTSFFSKYSVLYRKYGLYFYLKHKSHHYLSLAFLCFSSGRFIIGTACFLVSFVYHPYECARNLVSQVVEQSNSH